MLAFHHQPLTDIVCFDNSPASGFRPGGILDRFCDYVEDALQTCSVEEQFLERVGRKIEVIRCSWGDDVFFFPVNRPSSINAVRAHRGIFMDICRNVAKEKGGDFMRSSADGAIAPKPLIFR